MTEKDRVVICCGTTDDKGKRMNETGSKKRCILVCAGDMEIAEIPVRDGDRVVAVDGGYLYCQALGIEPDVLIGDFDSLGELQEQPGESFRDATAAHTANGEENTAKKRIIRLDPVKDDTDTLAALRYGLEQGYEEFHLYCALGGRLEHTIANLQCLLFLKHAKAAGYLWDGNSMTTVIQNESLTFRQEMEGMLSVFAIGERAEGVTEKGLKYLLEDATLTNDFPVGISNEFIGEKAVLSVKNGTLLVIVRWE